MTIRLAWVIQVIVCIAAIGYFTNEAHADKLVTKDGHCYRVSSDPKVADVFVHGGACTKSEAPIRPSAEMPKDGGGDQQSEAIREGGKTP